MIVTAFEGKVHISSFRAVLTGALLLAMFADVRPLPAQGSNAAESLPTAQDTLGYLKNTIDWYRQSRVDEQFATNAADIIFIDNDRQLAKQILRLSFDFARAEAKLISSQSNGSAAEGQTSD